MTSVRNNISFGWERLIMQIEMARHYAHFYALDTHAIQRNPILESLLPELLYVKMASLLDEGLDGYLEINSEPLPSKYNNSLHGKIEYLCDEEVLTDREDLHRIRDTRNDLAHESEPENIIDWKFLDDDMDIASKVLSALGFDVESIKAYEYFAERSAAAESEDPNVLCEYTYTLGVKKDGKRAYWYNQVVKVEK